MARKLILTGMVPTGFGTFRKVELKGPPDYPTWVACMMVFRSAVVMLGVIGVNAIDAYMKKVGKLASDYGTSVWLLLYQAEMRMRLERIPKIRRKLHQQHDAVTKTGGVHPYNPASPWRLVWGEAVSEKQ